MISILMPIYNGIEYIDESVTSVLDQTYGEWELIIGINGHEPNSIVYRLALEYERIDSRIKVRDMHDIKGKANTLNAMLEYCSYDWIALLDVDDIFLPSKLEKQIPYLKSFDVVGSKCVYFENLEGTVPQIPVGDISAFDFKIVNPIINSSVIIRKCIATNYGWDATYESIEDYALWLQLRRDKKTFYNIDEVLLKHRIHSSSAFNTQDNRAKLAQALRAFTES